MTTAGWCLSCDQLGAGKTESFASALSCSCKSNISYAHLIMLLFLHLIGISTSQLCSSSGPWTVYSPSNVSLIAGTRSPPNVAPLLIRAVLVGEWQDVETKLAELLTDL